MRGLLSAGNVSLSRQELNNTRIVATRDISVQVLLVRSAKCFPSRRKSELSTLLSVRDWTQWSNRMERQGLKALPLTKQKIAACRWKPGFTLVWRCLTIIFVSSSRCLFFFVFRRNFIWSLRTLAFCVLGGIFVPVKWWTCSAYIFRFLVSISLLQYCFHSMLRLERWCVQASYI